MPYKTDFGKPHELEEGSIYYQDFCRLKAVLNNNVAASWFNLNNIDEADSFNNQALIEDPDYCKALHRKCLILQKQGQYSICAQMLTFFIKKYDHPDETEEARSLIPKMRELLEDVE